MMASGMRVLMSGGGTGGHLYPGVAVALELRRRHPTARVVFAGTGRGSEAETVAGHGFDHVRVRSAGLKSKSLGAVLNGLALVPLSGWDAWWTISRINPDLVIGLGGYSSGAVVLAAAWRWIPTMLLEQNARPGLTNRLLARVATTAAVSHKSGLTSFRGKGFVAGNPVRAEFFETRRSPRSRRDAVHVLILGGSQGAHAINVAMMAAASVLVESRVPLRVTHQTGRQDCELVKRAYLAAGLGARVEPFLTMMADTMRDADLVVSRAGATTLAELAAVGLPSLLVPFPGAADGHQHTNAEVFAEQGAAQVLLQETLTGDRLASWMLALADDNERRERMAVAATILARPDAASVIVDRAEQLMGESGAGRRETSEPSER